MKHILKASIAVIALAAATPAFADVVMVPASTANGVLVHGTGPETTALEVIGNLGSNGPNIVHFNGTTTGPTDEVRLQGGSGQADITGAEITPGGNPEGYDLITANIFLTGHAGMDYIEFALTGADGTNGGTVDFFITDDGGTVWPFLNQLLGSGDTHFAFDAINGQTITNVFFSVDSPPGSVDILKQVRIIPGAGVVPEPSTWAMMLLGFGAVGFSMRRRRKEGIPQLA